VTRVSFLISIDAFEITHFYIQTRRSGTKRSSSMEVPLAHAESIPDVHRLVDVLDATQRVGDDMVVADITNVALSKQQREDERRPDDIVIWTATGHYYPNDVFDVKGLAEYYKMMDASKDMNLMPKTRKDKRGNAIRKFKWAVEKKEKEKAMNVTSEPKVVHRPEDVFTEKELRDYNEMIAQSKNMALAPNDRYNKAHAAYTKLKNAVAKQKRAKGDPDAIAAHEVRKADQRASYKHCKENSKRLCYVGNGVPLVMPSNKRAKGVEKTAENKKARKAGNEVIIAANKVTL
jgi:hypothetical protein